MNKKWLTFITAALLALFLVACNGEDLSDTIEDVADQVGEVADEVAENADEISEAVEETVEEVVDTAEDVMSDGAIAGGGAGYIDRALAGEFAGTTVTMLSVFSGEDEIKLNASIEEFEAATGIDFVYEGTSEFEAIVTTRVEGGDAADIIGFPQPGLLANFARRGFVVDLNEHFDRSYLEGQYIDSWLDMATFEGESGDIMGGVWHRTNGKSQVWYPKTAWEAAGYDIPTTHAEMLAVMDQIVADGDTPWCIGIESGAATGWTATDWTEEYMLRTTSLENYDAWVRGDLDFDSPEVKNAIETWSEIWFNDDYVLGGREQIATTFFGDSPTAMFEDPPRCWMHKQGSFITSFFPEGTEPGVDYDFFYLPPVGDEYGRPYLVAGDIYAAFSDRPEVLAFMEYFSRGESLRSWMEAGGAISPHRDVDLSWHGDPIEAAVGEAIANATSVRFDASDLMPGEVGAGTFWTGMTSYVNGDADLDTILAEVEASWPEGITGEDASEIESGGGDMMSAGFMDRALAGEFAGETVTMLSVFSGEDEIKLNASIEEFEAATGIDFVYEGTSEFEAIVTTRVEGGDAADIIGFPQPGLLANFARRGFVVDLNEHFSRDYLEQQYINSWLDMATFEGENGGDIMGGVWHRTNGKSQVWYPKAAWDAAGYPIPTTHAEMLELMDLIVADGDTPWCIGIESGAATGWTATDWTEEYMLRTTSLENYDAWVRGDLDFDSPEVKNAIETWSEIWFNDDYVLGGREQIATTFFGDSPTAMFEDPPRCWMHKQGSFITSFFPEGTEPGVDYDFFYLPPVGDEYGRPYLVAGDIYAAFSDEPAVLAFMEYFSRGESLRKWMEAGGAISPHRDVDLSWHGDPIEAAVGEAIANATSVRFDASDLMPGEVGAGTFWTGMTSYINGDADLDTILAEIEASWPAGIEGEDASEIEGGESGDLSAGFLDRALAGEFDGTTVTMLSVFSGEDEIKLNASIEEFEAATGIDFVYEGTSEFEAIVTTRVEGGDAADIIGFPQPGLLANFARDGFVVDLNEHFSRDYLEQQYIGSWLDMATFEGADGEDIMGGVWHRTNGKSQVWYPKAAWDAAGYPIPTTHAEMLELMDLIVADGDTPWCIGIESGAATGWTATDWTEEYMLRTTSLDNYDAWVRGELDFTSPEVKTAIETWSEIWFNDDYVLGGREQIATTFFGDSPTAMFEDPPRCWMHKQGSFITSFFPEGTEPGVDYDFFYLPPVGDDFGRPYLVAGDIYAAFSDRPEVLAFMEYFSSAESLRKWMEAGGAISPHRDVDLSWHGDPIEAAVGEAIANATSVRFDASDLMPGEVGAGTFWTGMTSYINGDADLDTILAEIEASWPEGIEGEDASEIEGDDG